MTLEFIVDSVPHVLQQLMRECVRRTNQALEKDPRSQETACLLLALRGVTLADAMGLVARQEAIDSFGVLARAFTETRDLLLDFRATCPATPKRITAWFEKGGWHVDRQRVERIVKKVSGRDGKILEFWRFFSVLPHPTYRAACDSVAVATARVTGDAETNQVAKITNDVRTHYLICISSIVQCITHRQAGWLDLGLDEARMPAVRPYPISLAALLQPIPTARGTSAGMG